MRKMTRAKAAVGVVAVAIAGIAWTGCGSDDVDQATDDIQEQAEQAADDIQEQAEETADDVQEQADEIQDDISGEDEGETTTTTSPDSGY